MDEVGLLFLGCLGIGVGKFEVGIINECIDILFCCGDCVDDGFWFVGFCKVGGYD